MSGWFEGQIGLFSFDDPAPTAHPIEGDVAEHVNPARGRRSFRSQIIFSSSLPVVATFRMTGWGTRI